MYKPSILGVPSYGNPQFVYTCVLRIKNVSRCDQLDLRSCDRSWLANPYISWLGYTIPPRYVDPHAVGNLWAKFQFTSTAPKNRHPWDVWRRWSAPATCKDGEWRIVQQPGCSSLPSPSFAPRKSGHLLPVKARYWLEGICTENDRSYHSYPEIFNYILPSQTWIKGFLYILSYCPLVQWLD